MCRDTAVMRRVDAGLSARQRQLEAAESRSSSLPADKSERTDLTSRLERLAALHGAGSLSDAEFQDAKRRVIAEVAAGR